MQESQVLWLSQSGTDTEYTWVQNQAFPCGRMLLAYPTVLQLFSW